MSTTTDVQFADIADLQKANSESWYFIAGAGGDLQDWVTGYQDLMETAGIGKPTSWFYSSGATVNLAMRTIHGGDIHPDDEFPNNLTCLLFPLEGLNISALAMFKLRMQDRWFDDVVDNVRTAG